MKIIDIFKSSKPKKFVMMDFANPKLKTKFTTTEKNFAIQKRDNLNFKLARNEEIRLIHFQSKFEEIQNQYLLILEQENQVKKKIDSINQVIFSR